MSTLVVTAFNGVAFGLLLFTLSVGLSVIYGLTDVLNLFHGAVAMLGAYLAYATTSSAGGLAIGLPIAALLGGGAGLLLGYALKPVAGYGHLAQALLTLGFAFILSDAISLVWGNAAKSIPAPGWLSGSVNIGGVSYPAYRIGIIAVAGALALAVTVAFERSRYGAVLRAAVSNREMLGLVGVNVNRALLVAYTAGTALAVFGGAVGAPVLGAAPGLGDHILLLALVVIIIGGLGSVRGTLLGALFVGLVQTLGAAYLPGVASFLLFSVMGLFLIFRPRGLLGYAESRGAY